MRDFNEDDKKKKRGRIQVPPNPANLSAAELSKLEGTVKSKLQDGNLPCGTAHKIAKDAGVPRIAVGEITDRLGIRIINCQIGCFKLDKNVHSDTAPDDPGNRIAGRLEELETQNELTCAKVFELAQELKLTPMAVADVANYRDMKVRRCQLGCF
jgi:hypothetical protein